MLTGCTTAKNTENSPETNNNKVKPNRIADKTEEYKKISMSEAKDLSDIEIVKQLFTKYLEHYMAKSIPDSERLISYKDIDIQESNDSGKTVFGVTYSIQPYKRQSAWIAGYGKPDAEGWMLKRILYVRLVKEEPEIIMEIMGTGL